MMTSPGDKTIHSGRVRLMLLVFLAMVGGAASVLCLFFLLFNTPSAVNGLAAVLEPITGYRIHVDGISLSSDFKGDISNLLITQRGETLPLAAFAHVEFKANPRHPTTALVEKLVLRHPRFRFVLKPEKKEIDWAGLDRLPPVKFLQIEQGEIDISSATYQLQATDLNVTIHDFSPRSGGRARLTSVFAMRRGNAAGGVEGNGVVSADIQLTSLFPRIAGKGMLSSSMKSADFSGLFFKDVVLDAPLSLDSEKLVFDGTAIRIGFLEYEADRSRGQMANVKLNGSGSFDRRSLMLSLKQLKGNLSDAGEFSGSGAATLSGSFPWKASLSARSIDFARVLALINPLLPYDYRKWGIQGKGDLDADLEGEFSTETPFGGTLRMSMHDAGFTSGDRSKAGAGLTGEIILRLHSPGSKKGDFTGRIDMRGGEFLWGAYYKDFKGESLALSSKGQFSLGTDISFDCAGDIDFYQTGNYTYRALFKEGLISFSTSANNLLHDRLYALLVKDFLGEDSALSGFQVSGVSNVELSLSRNRGRTAITGRLKVAGASLSVPKYQVALEALNVNLPFNLLYTDSGTNVEDEGTQEAGLISLKRFRRAGIILEGIEIPLAVARNQFQTLKGIDADLFGGRVRVESVRARNLLTPTAEVLTRVTVEHVDLMRLTQEFLGVAVQGIVDADLGEISLREGKWSSSGGIRVKVFGGEVEMKNISASDLLAPSRTFAGDVAFGSIDLEQVTSLIEMGNVTGFIKGTISDFAMTYGEPSSFVLVLESDTSKSARRVISVDAIKNLSIIGTGSSGISAVLNSGINRFFRVYPYSRIGIMCTLKNDTFSLRGTIREGNTEYLVRRGLFRGIDVINQSPDNAISFRDMKERIGRIFQSGKATTEVS